MTHLEAYAYDRIEELERKMDLLREGLEELNIKLRIITDSIKDEQTRRKWGVSDEDTKLLTAEEWERKRNYHEYRSIVGKSKSSEQWLKEHNCSEDKEEENGRRN